MKIEFAFFDTEQQKNIAPVLNDLGQKYNFKNIEMSITNNVRPAEKGLIANEGQSPFVIIHEEPCSNEKILAKAASFGIEAARALKSHVEVHHLDGAVHCWTAGTLQQLFAVNKSADEAIKHVVSHLVAQKKKNAPLSA